LDTINLYKLITVLINNDEFLHIRAYLYEFAAILKLADSAHKEALHYIRLSIKNKPRASSYIFEIKLLRLMGRHEEAGNLIEIFSKNAAKDPRKYLAYRNIIKSLQ
ncbi:MAG: hypothetical protein R3321_03830, partial [Nitrososphaeraceae archaeon]|nr:hypothetical protein [Nitrososphaeraceae archaeon]